MPEIKKGSFSLDLKFFKLGAELSEEDRQCAWELYTEIITRVAIVGKWHEPQAKNFDGEIYAESLGSVYRFFQECRSIMRKFPVGKLEELDQDHLGVLIQRILTDIFRPFLEKWQAKYRTWWDQNVRPGKDPFALQSEFPERDAMLEDWRNVRLIMRKVALTLSKSYKLKPVIETTSLTKVSVV
jgi:hypothetical protein